VYCAWSNIQRKCKTAVKYSVFDKIRGNKTTGENSAQLKAGADRQAFIMFLKEEKTRVDRVKDGNEGPARRKA
jgi:hypothetical protein